MPKVTLDPKIAARFLNVSPTVLVTSSYDGFENILTCSWNVPVSFYPPLVSIVIGQGRYSHYLIESSRQFIINVPDQSLMETVKYCGSISGRKRNKFRELEGKISRMPGVSMPIPIIQECFAHIECLIHRSFEIGDHTIFVGSIQSVLAEKGIFTSDDVLDVTKKKPIIHLGGDTFGEITPLRKTGMSIGGQRGD